MRNCEMKCGCGAKIVGHCPACGEWYNLSEMETGSTAFLDLLNKWCDNVLLENFFTEVGVVKWRCKIGHIEVESYNALEALRKCDKLMMEAQSKSNAGLEPLARKECHD